MTFISLCPRLEELDLEFNTEVDDKVMLLLCQKLKHLKVLMLSRCNITASSADYIVEHCHTLKQLSVPYAILKKDAIEKLKTLENVKLTDCRICF